MSRTKTAPWDYRQRPPTIAELRETNTQLKYYILVNKLERDYGIDYIANIVKSWGDISYAKKLELAIQLEAELDTKAALDAEAEKHDWENDPKHFKTNGVY